MLSNSPEPNKPSAGVSIANMAESLSQVMVSLLERRYLTDFRPASWKIAAAAHADTHVFLREVQEMGRDHIPEEMFRAVPYILAACHDPGYAFISTFFGSGTRQHIYLGGRRMPGRFSNRSIPDYLSGVYSAFKSFNGGLVLSDPHVISSGKCEALHNFLKEARSFSVLTGIPSGREGVFSLNFQGLDRLSRAAGSGQYAFMVVAEPVPAADLDATLDICRRLKSEIHSLVRTNHSYSRGTSHSVTNTVRDPQKDGLRQKAPTYLMGAALFLEAIQLIPGVRSLTGIITLLQGGGMQMLYQQRMNEPPPKSVSDSESTTETEGREVLDAHAEAVEQLLTQHIARLQSARSNGWWNVAVYVAAANSETLHNVTGALKSICSGDKTYLDPIRELKIDPTVVREAMLGGHLLKINPLVKSDASHPLGPLFNYLSTCLNSDELSVLAHLPVKEMPGLLMRGFSKFSLSVPALQGPAVRFGNLYNGTDQSLSELNIPLKSLNLHALITGMPGSGKTTTCMQLITEAYLRHNVPFLVIEPAKKEYRQLAQVPALRKGLRVFSIGVDAPTPLRINPFEFLPGVSLSKHIDLLKAVFNASFPMFAGMSYVLEEAMLAVYQERGWNIYTSKNVYLKEGDPEKRVALMPTLGDLLDKIEDVLVEKKYGQEIHQNLGAALRSRIKSLTVLTKGQVLNSQRSSSVKDMMENPSVIELQDLGDDQEKAFVMALLLVNIYEYAELRQQDPVYNGKDRLQHLTLIEEAHRLLSSGTRSGGEENGDPRGKAVSMFTDMLAEIRAYGEGLLIADQIPTKLAPEILKNTNLKIVHRLNAPDDRKTMGRSINLTDAQSDYLNNLPTFFAVIHDANINEAVMAKVYPFKTQQLMRSSPAEDEALLEKIAENIDKSYLKRHQGCAKCPRPCRFYHHQDTVADALIEEGKLKSLHGSIYLEGHEKVAGLWAALDGGLREKLPYTDESMVKGILFCLLVNFFRKLEKVKQGRVVEGKPLAQRTLEIEGRMAVLSEIVSGLLGLSAPLNEASLGELRSKLVS